MEHDARRPENGRESSQFPGHGITYNIAVILLFVLLMGLWAWLWVRPPY